MRIRGCGRVEEEVQRMGEGVPACLSRGGHIYKFTIRMRMARGSGRFSVSLPLTSRPEGPISAFLPSLPRCSFFCPVIHMLSSHLMLHHSCYIASDAT